MTLHEFLALMRKRRVRLALTPDGKVLAAPGKHLTADDAAWLKANRDLVARHLADDGRTLALEEFDARHGLPRFDGSDLDGPRVLIPDGPGKWFVMLQSDYDFLRAEAREARARADRAAGSPERRPARRPTGQTEIA